jgi:hypothetical protein
MKTSGTHSTNKFLLVLVMMLAFSTSAFAAVPQVVTDYVQIFVDLAKGQAGIIFIILVLAMSGFMAWRNGNLSPLFWGVAAAILIGGAPYIAPEIITFGETTFTS